VLLSPRRDHLKKQRARLAVRRTVGQAAVRVCRVGGSASATPGASRADADPRARQVEDALMMGADYYETLEECALIPGCLPMGLGAPARACAT